MPERLSGLRVLVVEDKYGLPDDTRAILIGYGVDVIGPVPTPDHANVGIDDDQEIDAVLLDVNLRGQMAFGVADTLRARGVPFAFVTGHDGEALPPRFADTPIIGKPIDAAKILNLFDQIAATDSTV